MRDLRRGHQETEQADLIGAERTACGTPGPSELPGTGFVRRQLAVCSLRQEPLNYPSEKSIRFFRLC